MNLSLDQNATFWRNDYWYQYIGFLRNNALFVLLEAIVVSENVLSAPNLSKLIKFDSNARKSSIKSSKQNSYQKAIFEGKKSFTVSRKRFLTST